MKFAQQRLDVLVVSLNYQEIDQLVPLNMVLQFVELLAEYEEGFKIIFEPYYDTGKIISPLIQLACLDSSLAMEQLKKKFSFISLTSGTISPMGMYAQILGLENSH